MKIYSILKSVLYPVILFIGTVHSATITVDGTDGSVIEDGFCSISEAIINANDDAQTHVDCIAGSGTDTIILSVNITLNAAFENNSFGSTGTPVIESIIILEGMGFSIVRDGACIIDNTNDANEFRHMRIVAPGDLRLNNITLSKGCSDGIGSVGCAIRNEGIISIENSRFVENLADLGTLQKDTRTWRWYFLKSLINHLLIIIY